MSNSIKDNEDVLPYKDEKKETSLKSVVLDVKSALPVHCTVYSTVQCIALFATFPIELMPPNTIPHKKTLYFEYILLQRDIVYLW
jgi:hypothetical protein